jgi:hypothetical protein
VLVFPNPKNQGRSSPEADAVIVPNSGLASRTSSAPISPRDAPMAVA